MHLSDIFPDRSEASLRLARNWLLLGLFSLIAAGLFSVLLVLSRTPAIQEIIPFIDFFRVALVVHVNLSVLIWFMSFACVLFTLVAEDSLMPLANLSFYLAVLGTLVLVIAPFFGVGDPLLNNYIPTLQHPVFFLALILFTAGVGLRLLINALATRIKFSNLLQADAIRMSVFLSALVCLLSILALYLSYRGIPDTVSGEAYYEFLYWGSGHILQFNHALLMLMAWLILMLVSDLPININGKYLLIFSSLVLLPVVDMVRIYVSYDVYSPEHRLAFTQLMKYGGLSCLPLGAYLSVIFFKNFFRFPENTFMRTVLLCSGMLFLTGGVIGFLIEGVNVVIPAHYHGSIVGVTLSFMGLAYLFMPFFGYAPVHVPLAKWQMLTYSLGQMMHIIGLAWSGGYGVQRKTAGLAQGLERIEQVMGMGLMGMGGLISIIGGVLFMIVMIKSIRAAS